MSETRAYAASKLTLSKFEGEQEDPRDYLESIREEAQAAALTDEEKLQASDMAMFSMGIAEIG